MKYKTVLQAQGNAGGIWYYYNEKFGGWSFTIYDNFGEYDFPKPEEVGAGRRLHVRLDKPQRPSAVEINAYPRVKGADFGGKRPAGQRQELKRTLRPVRQNGETVGWDAFFRVGEPERRYYLVVRMGWERVVFPGTHINWGKTSRTGCTSGRVEVSRSASSPEHPCLSDRLEAVFPQVLIRGILRTSP